MIYFSLLNRWSKFTNRDKSYWNKRYRTGGNSGHGSYGKLALYKSKVLNDFIKEHEIHSAIDFGCGDGNQIATLNIENYLGLDISSSAIEICKEKYVGDDTKSFILYDWNTFTPSKHYDISLSLDVLFHITEDLVFRKYIDHLITSAQSYIIIYSGNGDYKNNTHIADRKFTSYLESEYKNISLYRHLENPYKELIEPDLNGTKSEFYIFRKSD